MGNHQLRWMTTERVDTSSVTEGEGTYGSGLGGFDAIIAGYAATLRERAATGEGRHQT